MLNPLVLVYALTLIASVFADYATDVRINKTYVAFMDRFETFLTKTGDQVVLQAYQSQLNSNASHSSNNSLSLDELRQYSNSVIDPLMDQYGPIAYQIIYNAGYNTKGNYYVFDNSTKQWHLPNQTAPANPVDGASLNAKHLGQELEKAFSQLLSNDQKQSVLQKRWMLRGVTAEAQSFVRNLHSLPADDALAHAIKFKETVTTSSPADQKALNEFINVVDNQLQLRKTGTTETNNFLKDIEINPNFYERKIKLSEKLKELEGNQAPEADQNVIRREISRLDEIIAAENRALFKSKIRNTIASFFMIFGVFTMIRLLFLSNSNSIQQGNPTQVPSTNSGFPGTTGITPDISDSGDAPTSSSSGFGFENTPTGTNTNDIPGFSDSTGVPAGVSDSSAGSISSSSAFGNSNSPAGTELNDPDQSTSFNGGAASSGLPTGQDTSLSNSSGQEGLAKIIRNPTTGTTYYLDETYQRYYYVDPATNSSVYYNG